MYGAMCAGTMDSGYSGHRLTGLLSTADSTATEATQIPTFVRSNTWPSVRASPNN